MKKLCLPIGSSGGHLKIFSFLPSDSYKGRTFWGSIFEPFLWPFQIFILFSDQAFANLKCKCSFLHTPIVSTISLPLLKTSPFRSRSTIPGALEEGYSHL